MKEKGDRRRAGKKRWYVCDCELLPTRELRLWFEGTRSVSLRNMLSVENKKKNKVQGCQPDCLDMGCGERPRGC